MDTKLGDTPRAAANDASAQAASVPEWVARPERSNTLALRAIVAIALTLGRRGRLLAGYQGMRSGVKLPSGKRTAPPQ